MTNALPVWKLNFAKFCAEGVKPEGNCRSFLARINEKIQKGDFGIKQLSKKNIAQRLIGRTI